MNDQNINPLQAQQNINSAPSSPIQNDSTVDKKIPKMMIIITMILSTITVISICFGIYGIIKSQQVTYTPQANNDNEKVVPDEYIGEWQCVSDSTYTSLSQDTMSEISEDIKNENWTHSIIFEDHSISLILAGKKILSGEIIATLGATGGEKDHRIRSFSAILEDSGYKVFNIIDVYDASDYMNVDNNEKIIYLLLGAKTYGSFCIKNL